MPTTPEILDNETYKGDRYTYGFRNRPPGYAHCPRFYIHGSDKPHPDFNHGTIDYSFRLTAEDIYRYELVEVALTLTSRRSWLEFLYRSVHRWHAKRLGRGWEAYYMVLTPTQNHEDVDHSVLWLGQQTEKSTWVLTPHKQAD